METYKRSWGSAYKWMVEWGGSVAREHLIDQTQPPVKFWGIEGIAALWAEKGSGDGYRLLDKPNAGIALAQMYVDEGGNIGPLELNTGPTLIAPSDGMMIPNGPWKDGGCGWVEPGKSAPDDVNDIECPQVGHECKNCVSLRAENAQLRDELLDTLRELRRVTR